MPTQWGVEAGCQLGRDTLMQSKKGSLVEVLINVGTGFIVSYILWLTLIPVLFSIDTHPGSGLGVTAVFTVASIARGYVIRRVFDRRVDAG